MATGRVPTTANSPLTTKGDLFGYSTSPARLAVGADGETIVADSAATTGLRYQSLFGANKNKIINGDFLINQRAFTNTTTDGTFGFDRWKFVTFDGTCTYSTQAFSPGAAPVTGYEGTNYARIVTSGQTLSSAETSLRQSIENVRTVTGATTISFWAQAGSGTPKIAIEFQQDFGSGGSGSVNTYAGSVTLSTSWTRYSVTFSVPSISGKTIGTSNAGVLALWISAGSNNNARTGSLGIQSNTFNIWGVQVEAGSVATAFQTATGTIQGELAACQRYFQKSYDQSVAPGTASADSGSVVAYFASNVGNGSPFAWTKLHQTMRTVPTLTIYSYGGLTTRVSDNNNTDLAANSATGTRIGEGGFGLYNNSGGTIAPGNNGFRFQWTGSAEL